MSDNSSCTPGPLQEGCPAKLEQPRAPITGATLQDQAPPREAVEEREDYPNFSSLPMTGLPLAGAFFGMCLGGPVCSRIVKDKQTESCNKFLFERKPQ